MISRTAVLGVVLLSASLATAQDKELVILTTFSREPLLPLIDEFSKQYQDVDVQVVHRRAQSSVQMLSKSYIQNIDIVLSSSPYLMQHLAENGRLTTLPERFQAPEWLRPYMLPPAGQVVTIGYSGAGIVWNRDYLQTHQLPKPKQFSDLASPVYFGHLTMSTPARSGTTQLMVESILAKYGWQEGWRLLTNIGANMATISSRSFGVSDYVAKGQFGIGPTIDSYALILERKFDHVEFAYDESFTLMPTYVGLVKQQHNDIYAKAFIDLLMSKAVQTNMDSNDFAKHGLSDNSLFNDRFTRLSVATLIQREDCMNLLFDLMISKRLPALKDTWLSLINARKHYQDNPQVLAQIKQIEQQIFSVPISEKELDAVVNQISPLADVSDDSQQAAKTMLLTELSHSWKKQIDANQQQANEQLKSLLRVTTP
ncbi:ABC transporter substrate-binding protein [Vibrio diazotrophicus]|uniref:ABC transporter substrate-binding protein n=1 Tax=Vibrio diazotrophicus TaxID=685 RepID=UPI000C9E4340|nr:ABC transporter substrate-binding protein [Vibrio diazotrophicus]PNH92055.1 ABC transporter substrate-binding protein [Vibrio diazotrophicus]